MIYLNTVLTDNTSVLNQNLNRVITKCYAKNDEYEIAINRLEEVINNSMDPDEVVLAMIDQGYYYMKLAELGSRALPERSTIKTRTIDEYQIAQQDLENHYSFMSELHNNDQLPEPVIPILDQNYPNPFNPKTTISFSIPENGNVGLSIYNIKGQKVKTLLNDNLEKGIHDVAWNSRDSSGKSVASGVYFYKFTVNGKIQG